MAIPFDRRGALALLAGGAAAAGMQGTALAKAARSAPLPILASPEQLAAERQLLALLKDPQLIALQAKIRSELLAGTIGMTRDGAATVERAVWQWTHSLIFGELTKYRERPTFIWGTDDTPRRWHGYELGGVGTSGDNPDAIYRTANIEGSRSYVLEGRLDPALRPAQLVIQLDAADHSNPASMMDMSSNPPRVKSSTLGILIDSKMQVEPDGSFQVTLGGDKPGPNHIALKPGLIIVGTRDMLSDWNQRPARLAIREISANPTPAFPPISAGAMREKVLEHLPGFIGFWADFPNRWFGGIKPNTHSMPMGRTGGWGFVAGLRFDLQPDEVMLVTTARGGAHYTGFQLNDPWMIQPDARKHQVCLNSSQALWNADGTATYVIASRDTGHANWLDPSGVTSGLGVMRWQAVPDGLTNDGLIRDLRVVKLPELAALNLPRVTPAQRRRTIARRAWDYAARTRG